jgi:hypothetical protein
MFRHAFYAITAYVALMGLWISVANANGDVFASDVADSPVATGPLVCRYWLFGNSTPEGTPPPWSENPPHTRLSFSLSPPFLCASVPLW